jgi:ligand-binding sensor domain-containing protein
LRRTLLFFATLVAGSTCAVGVSAAVDPWEIARPPLRVFSDHDGLPQNSVIAMTFDSRGVLWLGTQDGAATWDGRHLGVVNMPNRTVSNFVNAIHADADGGVWFGTQGGGLHHLLRGAFKTYTTADGLPDDVVTSIQAGTTRAGAAALWVATNHGLALVHDGRIEKETGLGALPTAVVNDVLELRPKRGGRTLFVATDGGLLRVSETERKVFGTASGFPNDRVFCL